MCDTCNPYCDHSCVSISPQGEVAVKMYDTSGHGMSISHRRDAKSIMWTVKFRNGKVKRITLPIRRTV